MAVYLPCQTLKISHGSCREREESEILFKTSDSKINTDNQENRKQSLDEISKKTQDKTAQTGWRNTGSYKAFGVDRETCGGRAGSTVLIA